MAFLFANGVSLRYEVTGEGPRLCLIIGYRLHGAAWPDAFVENLARRFSVLTFDNRGTGLSEKPAYGYSLDIMAADVAGTAPIAWGGPARMCSASPWAAPSRRNWRSATLSELPASCCSPPSPAACSASRPPAGAEAPVRDRGPFARGSGTTGLAGYLFGRLLGHEPDVVEAQMRREIAYPTPDHAARGQGAAICAFSSALRLSQIPCRDTGCDGHRGRARAAGHSRILASRIPIARLALLPGLGHRAIWEAPEQTADLVGDFLASEAISPHSSAT